jgi:NAD(P)-dependent dehydrogenase (short-subunit alcohol dehydrogenase family)
MELVSSNIRVNTISLDIVWTSLHEDVDGGRTAGH